MTSDPRRPLPCSPPPAGGMERPRDDYKLTHNVRLATRDKLFGGQVSRLQVRLALLDRRLEVLSELQHSDNSQLRRAAVQQQP